MDAPHMSPEEFRQLGHRAIDWIADYMRRVEELPVRPRVGPGAIAAMLPAHAPERGLAESGGWDAVFADLERVILPGLLHWQSPRFFGYFPCNASGPGILGEVLSAGLNVNGMLWATSPAATELEMRVVDWMGELIGLPREFLSGGAGGGCIQGTASESTLIAMLAARERAMGAAGEGGELVVYASTQAHSSVVKGAMIAGLARGPEDHRRVRLIDVDENFAMRADLLRSAMEEDRRAGRRPFYVCATVGTTSSTAIDPVREIARVLQEAGGEGARPWLHVDAAHAGAACVCPEFRWLLDGVDGADSICFNPHKWLLTNFDCDCFWLRDRAALTRALSITPEYLRNRATDAGEVIDYRDWQIPLGRRLRALKLWLVLRHYGAEGLRAFVRGHVRLAAEFESWVRTDERFEVVALRTVNLVCFRLRGSDEQNHELMERINASGRAFLSHTTLGGRYVLRMCIGSAGTGERHVREAWDLIRERADG
jgi:aromatic-L-amino-acid/L-tryptophan decarboxylase